RKYCEFRFMGLNVLFWIEGDMSYVTAGGGDFTPYIFRVEAGEDIIQRIMSFTENGARGVVVLSANGWVTNVKIQTLDSARKVVTHEATYDLVSLSSSMTTSDGGSVYNQTGGWRIRIAAAGVVFSGVLVGRLIAASQVQVVVGSFWPLVTNPPQRRYGDPNEEVVAPEMQNSSHSSSKGKVQQPDMMASPSQPQEKINKSRAVTGASPIVPSTVSFTREVPHHDMSGSSHSHMRTDEFQTMNVSARVPNSLAFSLKVQVQQPEIGSHLSLTMNEPSQGATVGCTTPSELAISLRGQVQQPEIIGPSTSHTRNDDSRAVVVPSASASSSTGEVTQPEMEGPILTLGWHN
ncbi:hypothetical protein CARUB_v10025148mg, partial [Capsella rubella]